jgi:hypothetical protein
MIHRNWNKPLEIQVLIDSIKNKWNIQQTELKKKHETVTKAKIKRAESAKLKGRASNKLHRKLTVKCSEMPASF